MGSAQTRDLHVGAKSYRNRDVSVRGDNLDHLHGDEPRLSVLGDRRRGCLFSGSSFWRPFVHIGLRSLHSFILRSLFHFYSSPSFMLFFVIPRRRESRNLHCLLKNPKFLDPGSALRSVRDDGQRGLSFLLWIKPGVDCSGNPLTLTSVILMLAHQS
jgi:hypothetical protein